MKAFFAFGAVMLWMVGAPAVGGSVDTTVNGCGSADFDVPDSFFKAVSFTEACNDHDRCYARCGATKADCDKQLGIEMAKACNKIILIGGLHSKCIAQAGIYYAALTASSEAKKVYEETQDTHCVWDPCCK